MFRELNESELAIVNKQISRKRLPQEFLPANLMIDYFIDGNFTIALIKQVELIKVGVSKFNPSDKINTLTTGQSIAFNRALLKF